MRCRSCSREIASGLKFCPLCGAQMGVDVAPVEGRPLSSWLDDCASGGIEIPLATAVSLLTGILDSLSLLHERGVVHCDVCPDNILIRGEPLAGDLEVTLLISPDAPSINPAAPIASNAEMLGARAYTAPEQRTAPENPEPHADLFAAGAILYELLLQVPPEGRWELPSAVRGDVPAEVDAFLMKALNPHPDRRFGETAEMIEAARHALGAAPRRFGYSPQEREGFERLLGRRGWQAGRGRRNSRGLLVTVHERTGLEFVFVPGGEFDMGLAGMPDAEPVHKVRVEPFLLCATPCTQEAWDRIGGEDRRRFRGPELPIEGVSYNGARAWCERAGNGLRLPSEAEWEFACRAGTHTAFCFGNEESGLGEYGWSREISGGRTHRVRGKLPNPWGLFDVHGNVWEWCEDIWQPGYECEPDVALPPVADRVGRGGSWRVSAHDCRSGRRSRGAPESRGGALGFRPAASLESLRIN